MSDKPSLATKVELQAALQTIERSLAMMQAARAQVFALLHAEDVRPFIAPFPAPPAPPATPPSPVPAPVPAAPPAPVQQFLAPPKAPPDPVAASAPKAPAAKPPGGNSGGYVHHRTRKDMLSEGTTLGIPEVALKHYRLLKDGVKPTKQGFLDAEDLIGKVRAAKAAGQDPAPLWAPYMPAT